MTLPRTFVAIGCDDDLAQGLALQAEEPNGWRFSRPEQLHITVQYLGPQDPSKIGDALADLASPAFVVATTQLGSFPAGKDVVLWAGVDPVAELYALHGEVGQRLAAIGCEPDDRLYRPHITLARGPKVLRSDVEQLLPAKLQRHSIEVDRVGIYTSESVEGRPHYELVDSIGLAPKT